jgi:magnesium chelatase family protein
MVDRIDLQVMVPEVPQALLTQAHEAPANIQSLKQTIERAYSSQIRRQGNCNARLDAGTIHTEIRNTRIGPSLKRTLEKKVQSARSLHKVWKVARTIADLDDARHIGEPHVIKALSFRTINWEDGLEVGLR